MVIVSFNRSNFRQPKTSTSYFGRKHLLILSDNLDKSSITE